MVQAIDACAATALALGPDDAVLRSEAFLAKAPTFREFRDRFLLALEPLLR